ncbi:ArsR family transcriptional regulator [Aliiroseovarius zhejiangensis]|uniref:ArsR family transcriptional regulator n=1 Tax=Aliiroseovarius zhejiangensis TaxID=1632025 RepID=A0ABQ3IZH4_9RHOB|nr:helix-turn-helix domain-containing protein [Aliiroseovarius zhejiangensis]GHE97879.1 ArsR family transcriptional regulator [Aliiroseovarius zhejiangensis]
MEILIPNRLTTLGHPQRLAVFRLLMRRYPDRVPATELAQALDLKPNTLSTYVNALMQAGLVTQERVGTSLRYAIDMDAARETFVYLLRDCCRGRPEICSPLTSVGFDGDSPMTDRKYKVLFICTGNSARSIFAESILRKEAGDRFVAYSAGTKPRSELNPFALEVLEQKGHDISVLESKNVSVFQGNDAPHFDFVFTVCNQAANEECPAWTGQPVSAHWGMPDPVKVEGSNAEKSLAFHQSYAALLNRIKAFTALPIASLDRIALQKAVDDIAQTNEGASA